MQLFWLIIIILLSIIEAFTINLVSIWFIVSGIITLVISLFTNNIIIQIALFTFYKEYLKKIFNI